MIADQTPSATAGMRLGWLTGSPAFIERIQRIAETDSQEVK
jgi:DNA-binding transcriptional MocR family regulator